MAYDGILKFDTALDSSGLQKGADKLGNIVKGLGVFKVIEQGMGAVVNSIDAAVSRVDTLNKFPRVMEQMGYGADSARTAMTKLSDGIMGLPTTLDGIVDSTQRLAIATGSLDKGADTALALNNALLASGASSEAASRGAEQYIQALSRNKMEMQEWKVLQETMPYALSKTAEAFGYTGTEAIPLLYNALSSGEITMTQFNDKLIALNGGMGGFAEVARTASGGIATSWTNVQTAVVRGTANVIQAVDSGLAKFGGIAGVMDTMKGAVNTAFTAISGAANVLMQNLDKVALAVIGVSGAFAAYNVIQSWNAAAKEAATVSAFLKETNQQLTLAIGKTKAAQLEQVAAAKLQEAQDARTRYEKLELIATEKKGTAEALKAAAAKATGTEATRLQSDAAKAAAVAEQAQTAAKNASTVANTASTASVQAEVAAQNARNTSLGLGTALVGYLTGSITLHTLATAAATVATTLFSMALKAIPLLGLVALIGAVIAGIVALIKWFVAGSEEFQKQKQEVEALTTAQEELAAATEESADAYKSNAAEIAASGKVSKNLVGALKEISTSTANADEKSRKMSATVDQLNMAVDGLNIAYDEETGAIRNINTGQEISLEQLEELVSAKAELAQANAWQERANELIKEQVEIQENLAVIEAKKQEIMENSNLRAGEQQRLIKELDEAAEGHAATMDDVETRLGIVNENISASNTAAAESVISDYERMEQAITENGENIDAVAARWGVSVESIKAAWADAGGSFDEFVADQDDAMAEYQESVSSHADSIINSFKEIPAEFEMSAQEMIDTLRTNRERYAEWKEAMVEISGQVSAETIAALEELGPGALSAINEMRENGGEGLRAFDEEIRATFSEATTAAKEEVNNPDFVSAPSGAIDTAAEQVAGNTALDTAMTGTMEGAVAAAEAVDFATVGQNIATDIVNGLNGADVSGAMNSIATAIQSGTGRVTSAVTSMSTSVQSVFRTMSTQSQTIATQMMTQINSTIISRAATVKSSITSMGNGITAALNTAKTQATSIATQMMTSINSAIISRAATVRASMTSCANGVVTACTDMKTRGGTIATQMMTDINTAIVTRAATVRASAASVANGVVSALEPMVSGGESAAERMMEGMLSAMNRKASSLYAKAREIANKIADILEDAWDEHSPSRVSYKIMAYFMQAMYNAMGDLSGMLYRKADGIAEGLTDRLNLDPDMIGGIVSRLRSVADTSALGGAALIPRATYAGAGGGTSYSPTLIQHITTPKPLSASELTREGQDMLRRSRWQLP